MIISSCCGQLIEGEVIDGVGRCSLCKEMSSVEDESEEENPNDEIERDRVNREVASLNS